VVDLQSNVSDVVYKVDDKPPSSMPLRLGLGAHTIEASALGYKSETRSITLSANSPKPSSVAFQLTPEPVRIKLESTLKSGAVSLDGGESENLQDGQFVKEGIALSTDHTFSLMQAGKESLTFSFRAEPGKAVTLSARTPQRCRAHLTTRLCNRFPRKDWLGTTCPRIRQWRWMMARLLVALP
jgi:hypothetical protein